MTILLAVFLAVGHVLVWMGDVVRCFLGVRGDVLRAEDFLSFVNFLLVKSCFLGVSIVMVGVVFLTRFGATASGLGVGSGATFSGSGATSSWRMLGR